MSEREQEKASTVLARIFITEPNKHTMNLDFSKRRNLFNGRAPHPGNLYFKPLILRPDTSFTVSD